MVDEKQLELLFRGVDGWNTWRRERYSVDLRGAETNDLDLRNVDLRDADLYGAKLIFGNLQNANLKRTKLERAALYMANLRGADLTGANLVRANLPGVNLAKASLDEADLRDARLENANLREASLQNSNLARANLTRADLTGANLHGTNLSGATLVGTKLHDANLTDCKVYGASAWSLEFSVGTKQKNLIITHDYEPIVIVDDIEVAQFLYLMLRNEKIRRIVDTITSKVVLILGRFTPERKAVLDVLRDHLHGRNYVPVIFDFDKPGSPTTVETITLLARMARFVIADLSDAKSVLQELQAIVPLSPKLAVQPLILAEQEQPGMLDFFESFPWFLKVHRYSDLQQLSLNLDEQVLRSVEAKVLELRGPQAD